MSPPGQITVRPIPIEWNPGMTVFASSGFLQAVGSEYGWLGGFDTTDTQRCFLPYTIVRKAGVRLARFRVETIPCVPDLPIEEERVFLNSVVGHFRRTGADVIIPASTNTIFRTYPDGSVAAPYGTHVVALNRPEDALWSGVSTSHRRQVRSAQKAGVKVRTTSELLPAVHAVIRGTFAKSSMRFMSPGALRRMVQGLDPYAHVFVAELNGRLQACAVMAFSRHSAYYMYGGSAPDAAPGAMHLLHWEAMRRYRELGTLQYDFCGARVNPAPGSKAEGLATFKQRFGSQFRQGFMWKCRLSPLRSALYSVSVRLLRGGDIVDAERHKFGPAVESGRGEEPSVYGSGGCLP